MKNAYIYIFISLSILSYVHCAAQSETQTVDVDFTTVLSEGFQNNYGLRLQNLTLEKDTYSVQQASGRLNPYIDFDVTKGTGIDPEVDNEGTEVFQSNLVIPTYLGIDLYTGVRRELTEQLDITSQSLHDDSSEFLLDGLGGWVGITMPLLQGLGKNSPVNVAIRTAKISQEASGESLSNEVMIYFRDLLSAYLNLKRDVVQYGIQEKALLESLKNKQSIYKLIENDNLPRSEKIRIDSQVLDQQQLLNTAELNALDSYYSLRLLTGVKQKDLIHTVPRVSGGIPDPDIAKIEEMFSQYATIDDSIIMMTPVYKNAALMSEAEKVELDFAENQKLHKLDLDFKVSRFDNDGLTTIFNDNNLRSGMYPGTSELLTLTYTLPLKNDEKKGAYLVQLAEYKTSKTQLSKLLFETKTGIQRGLVSLKQLLNLYKSNIDLVRDTRRSYEIEKEKFKLGRNTQIDVNLSFQDSYKAELNRISIKFKIYSTMVQLKYLLGQLPSDDVQLNNFSLEKYFASY